MKSRGKPIDETNLTELIIKYDTVAPIASFVVTIRETWLAQQISVLSDQVKYYQQTGKSSSEILNYLDNEVTSLSSKTTRRLPTMGELLSTEQTQIISDIKRIRNGERLHFGLSTGLAIDKVVPGGLPLGKIVAIYGESGNFKTTTKNNIVWGIAKSGVGAVLDLSFEDDDLLTTQRAIARFSKVGYGKIATRELTDGEVDEISDIDDQAKVIANNVIMGAEHPVNAQEIINTARYYKNHHNLVAVVIDYMQLVANDKDSLDRDIRLFQLAAKRDNLCYILVSQVKQDVDFRAANNQNARPRITDMLGSSSFRTAPKLSLGVYRPWKYHQIPPGNPGRGIPNYSKVVSEHPDGFEIYKQVLELWVSKNIFGEQQVCIPVLVDLETGALRDLPDNVKEML